MKNVKVILYGTGEVCSRVGRVLLKKRGFEIVGAIGRKTWVGKDLSKVLNIDRKLGVTVSNNVNEILKADADIVIHATTTFLKETFPEIARCVKAKKNVISACEELVFPYFKHSDIAKQIDELAKENGVTVLGCGSNPGFLLDTLIITLSGACQDIKKIKARRPLDATPITSPVRLRQYGIGLNMDEFRKGLEDGSVYGHVGLHESITMIATAIGWKLDDINETKEPIISDTYRETSAVRVEIGQVAGFKQTGIGIKDGEPIIILEYKVEICPKEEVFDVITIEGHPLINVTIKPQAPGYEVTAAVMVNMIPHVINAPPGLVTMKDLPVPRAMMGEEGL